jgi:dTDP-4-amino-4,6-dideoxygalactose transaminase
VDRDKVQARLAEDGIDTMVYYPVPCHRLKVYEATHAWVSCPEAERACGEVLSLPFWPGIPESVQAEVAEALRSAMGSLPSSVQGRS